MKKKFLFLLLILCVSLIFVGFGNRIIDKSTKESTFQSSNDDNIEENILKSEKSKLYAMALDAAWEDDKGLNSNIKYISIDTKTFRDFTEEDKSQLFDYISSKYNVTMLDKSYEELIDEGYIKEDYFKEGLLFQIDKYNVYDSNLISFEGIKFRSSIGAIGFLFKGEKKNNKWELREFKRLWIA